MGFSVWGDWIGKVKAFQTTTLAGGESDEPFLFLVFKRPEALNFRKSTQNLRCDR
jgi:hypothetical protein